MSMHEDPSKLHISRALAPLGGQVLTAVEAKNWKTARQAITRGFDNFTKADLPLLASALNIAVREFEIVENDLADQLPPSKKNLDALEIQIQCLLCLFTKVEELELLQGSDLEILKAAREKLRVFPHYNVAVNEMAQQAVADRRELRSLRGRHQPKPNAPTTSRADHSSGEGETLKFPVARIDLRSPFDAPAEASENADTPPIFTISGKVDRNPSEEILGKISNCFALVIGDELFSFGIGSEFIAGIFQAQEVIEDELYGNQRERREDPAKRSLLEQKLVKVIKDAEHPGFVQIGARYTILRLGIADVLEIKELVDGILPDLTPEYRSTMRQYSALLLLNRFSEFLNEQERAEVVRTAREIVSDPEFIADAELAWLTLIALKDFSVSDLEMICRECRSSFSTVELKDLTDPQEIDEQFDHSEIEVFSILLSQRLDYLPESRGIIEETKRLMRENENSKIRRDYFAGLRAAPRYEDVEKELDLGLKDSDVEVRAAAVGVVRIFRDLDTTAIESFSKRLNLYSVSLTESAMEIPGLPPWPRTLDRPSGFDL